MRHRHGGKYRYRSHKGRVIYKKKPIHKFRKLNKYNVAKRKIPNKSGMYILKDNKNKELYVGSTKKLRHRLQSYYQKDDYKEHPTKKLLRNQAEFYSCYQMPINEARELEKELKGDFKFNKTRHGLSIYH